MFSWSVIGGLPHHCSLLTRHLTHCLNWEKLIHRTWRTRVYLGRWFYLDDSNSSSKRELSPLSFSFSSSAWFWLRDIDAYKRIRNLRGIDIFYSRFKSGLISSLRNLYSLISHDESKPASLLSSSLNLTLNKPKEYSILSELMLTSYQMSLRSCSPNWYNTSKYSPSISKSPWL